MKHLVRGCWRERGYVYATRAEEIARMHGILRPARLASNESPFPPSPKAVEMAVHSLQHANRYPPESLESLQCMLQRVYGDYHFVIGSGMDGVIETVVRMLVDPRDRVVIATPTFSFYGVASAAQGAEVVSVPRDPEDFSVDPDRFIEACRGAKLAFLCSPNNPTGNITEKEVIGKIAESIDAILFLDNAYVEFSGEEYTPLMRRYQNLVIGRTMSKIHSLAGLRLGYAFVPGWFVPFYRRAATPFAVNVVTAAAAEGALSDREHTSRTRDHIRRWRQRYREEIRFRTYPSESNFVLIDVAPHTGDAAMEMLAARGVLVRSCTSFPGLGDHFIRVSIGDDWENERFIEEINSL
jgi:histidinol-phosphate aminotransferase